MKSKNLRWLVVTLSFVLGMVCYIDRMNIAVAAVPIMQEFKINATQFGYAVSAFTVGYFLFSLPTGTMVDRIGVRRTVIFYTIGWAIMTVLSGMAWALIPLIIFRFVFGATETVLTPSVTGLANNWALPSERGRVIGIFLASLMMGVVVGAPLNAFVLSLWNWRAAFYVTGALSLIVTVLYLFFVTDRPEQHKWITKQELELIKSENNREAEGSSRDAMEAPVTLGTILSNKTLWVTGVALFLINFLYWSVLQWLPAYFRLARHSSVMSSGVYTALPFLAAAIGSYLSGELTDRLFKGLRIPVIVMGSILAAPFTVWGVWSSSLFGSVIAFTCATFFNQWAVSQTITLPMELFPAAKGRAPTISAFYVTCNSLAGILAPLIIGRLYDVTNSFSTAFYMFGIANLIGGLLYLSAFKAEKKIKFEL